MSRIISFIVLICMTAVLFYAGSTCAFAENTALTDSTVQNNVFKAAAVGEYHTVALKEDGTVIAWGYNKYGQCNVPTGLSGVKAIAAGSYHTVALKEDGTVIAWGYNKYGQCNVPSGLSGVKAISTYEHITIALKEDGTIIKWGDSDITLEVLSGIKAISAATALKEDGTVIELRNRCSIPFPKANPVITIYPSEITAGKSNEVMVTANNGGYPADGGTIDIGDYIKGQILDSNGEAKVTVTPTAKGDIIVNAYDKNHNLLASKTIVAITILFGDVNGDRKVDVVDATMLKSVVIKKNSESILKNKAAADMNSDGTINSLDYLMLKKTIQDRI